MESEDGINILIKRAYIEKLEFDVLDKIQEVWQNIIDFIGDVWDALLGLPPSAESITDEEGDLK